MLGERLKQKLDGERKPGRLGWGWRGRLESVYRLASGDKCKTFEGPE